MYFAFEVRYGDNNDQAVADMIVEAPTREQAFEVIEAAVKTRISDVEIDGDDMVLQCMWYVPVPVDSCDEVNETHNHFEPRHEDYLLMGECEELHEALAKGSAHHERWAPLRFDAKA